MEDNKQTKKQREAFAFGIKLKEWVLAGVVGVVSGLITSVHKVNELFHDDARNATAFKGHFDGYNEKEWVERVSNKYEDLRLRHIKNTGERVTKLEWEQRHASEIAEDLNHRPIGIKQRLDNIELRDFAGERAPQEYRKAIRAEKKVIAEEFADLALKFRGIRKNRILSTIDKIETLSDRSMGALGFNGAIGAAIGAAMTLSFFNGVATRDKIDKIADAAGIDTTSPSR